MLKLVPNHYQFSSGEIHQCYRRNLHWNLDISDLLDWAIYFDLPEPAHQRLLSLAKHGNFVIDIGSNLGGTCLPLALRVGEDGLVFAFEPFPPNFQRLERSVKLNPMAQLKIFPTALGNSSGLIAMETPTNLNSGSTRILPERNACDQNPSSISVQRLDDLLAKMGNTRKIDLIKIDVEGYELNVLRGAERSLQEFSPRLFIELEDDQLRRQGFSAKQLLQYLENLGYKVVNALDQCSIDTDNLDHCVYDIIATK